MEIYAETGSGTDSKLIPTAAHSENDARDRLDELLAHLDSIPDIDATKSGGDAGGAFSSPETRANSG